MSPGQHWQHQQAHSHAVPILPHMLMHSALADTLYIQTCTHGCTLHTQMLPTRAVTCTLTTPPICRRSHMETHAYHAPHPCRCSGACLASIPLSLHPSLASNPSLRRLPSVDQRCKTLPPAPLLSLNPPSLSPFCLIENVYSRRDPGEGENMSEVREAESRQVDGKRGR